MAELLDDPGIVRNRLKVRGVIKNARAFLDVQEEFGSFDAYIWTVRRRRADCERVAHDAGGPGADG